MSWLPQDFQEERCIRHRRHQRALGLDSLPNNRVTHQREHLHEKKKLLSPEEISLTLSNIYAKGGNVMKVRDLSIVFFIHFRGDSLIQIKASV